MPDSGRGAFAFSIPRLILFVYIIPSMMLINSCESDPRGSYVVPDTLSTLEQVSPGLVETLMPTSWPDSVSSPWVLVQYKRLLTMEDVSNQRRAFGGPYCRVKVDSLQKLFIYRSDAYYNMVFDGGENAYLLDLAKTNILPVVQPSSFTALYHKPSRQILSMYPDFMEMYALCDWIDTVKKDMRPS